MPKLVKVILSIFLPIIILSAILAYLITWNSSSFPTFPQLSGELAAKIINIPKNRGVITLTNEELNGLISLYPTGENVGEDLNIKAIYTEIAGDEISIYMPSNYKGINVLLSSKGKLYLKDEKIVYDIENFKSGKLRLPKRFILNSINQQNLKGITVSDNKILIDINIFPLKVRKLQLKDNKITIGF